MSLDLYLESPPCPHCGREAGHDCVSFNVTHNLTPMAGEADLYGILWRPEENGIETAEQLIAPLEVALAVMEGEPERFTQHNPENGWGTYDGFVEVCKALLDACRRYPTYRVRASR